MINSSKFSKIELYICLFLFTLISFFFYFGYLNSWLRGAGDNALSAEITYNIAHTGNAYSHIGFSILDFQQSPFFNQTSEEISRADFSAKDYSQLSVMKFHFTPLYYIIAPLTLIFKSQNIFSFLTAISFSGMILICYFLMRYQTIPPFGATLFTIFLSTHPAWSASLFGQFYIDRFFLIIGFIFCVLVYQKKSPQTILIWSILCSLIIEKMTIITGVYLLLFTLLYWKHLESRTRKGYLYIATFLFFYSFFILKFILSNHYYGTFLSLHQVIYFYQEVLSPSRNLLIFSFFSILPLIIFAIFEWRFLILALVIMGPNLMGSIGGAEKSGWSTHYHTTYLPVLFLALVLGFSSFYKKLENQTHRLALYFFIIAYTLVVVSLVPYTLKFSKNEYLQNGFFKSISLTRDFFDKSGVYSNLRTTELALQDNIPPGSRVSVPEALCVPLARTRKIFLYPQGIKDVDFVVVFHEIKDGKNLYKGQYYAQSSDEIVKINTVLNKKLEEYGFNLKNPIIINDIAILKRITPKS